MLPTLHIPKWNVLLPQIKTLDVIAQIEKIHLKDYYAWIQSNSSKLNEISTQNNNDTMTGTPINTYLHLFTSQYKYSYDSHYVCLTHVKDASFVTLISDSKFSDKIKSLQNATKVNPENCYFDWNTLTYYQVVGEELKFLDYLGDHDPSKLEIKQV